MSVPSGPATQVAGGGATAAWANQVKAQLDYLTAASSTAPVAQLRQTLAQSLPNATYTPIAFDTEDTDLDGGHSTTTNTSRYTSKTAGWYLVSGVVAFAAAAAGQRLAGVAVNGTQQVGIAGHPTASASNGNRVDIGGRLVYLAVNDYVELLGYQDTGGALNTASAGPIASVMHVVWQRS